ncbi:MAG: cytochrome c oxidase assembly protein [Betaproteobacteria bacterium]|nr:MAG: cytochrome c oxidase assembly protein [Betaproteobacteria bacterium]
MTLAQQNRQLFAKLALVAAGMFGFGYALVPFYYQICAAWGVNALGEVREAPVNTQVDRARVITVEFDANAHGLPWRFRPLVNHIQVHPGELATVEYEVSNERSVAITGQAVPSYGPAYAGEYFKKVECFCFTQQTLAPGETRRMPVTFVIDPRLPRDVSSIALSYTFFEVAGRGGKS